MGAEAASSGEELSIIVRGIRLIFPVSFEYGGSNFIRNISDFIPDCASLHHIRP